MIRLGLDPTLFTDLVDPGDARRRPAAPRRRAGRRSRARGRRRLARHRVRRGRRPDADRRRGVRLPRHLGPGRSRARRAGADRGGAGRELHQRGRRRRHRPVPQQRDGHLAAQRDACARGARPTWPGRCAPPRRYDGPVPVVDVQDPRFLPPGDMEARIRAWCAEHDVAPPNGRVAVVRCIVESIAAAIGTALQRAAALAGPPRRRRARRRRRQPEHPALPGDRRPHGPAGAGRTRRGDGPRQRARPGPHRRRRRPGPRRPARAGRPHPRPDAVRCRGPERIEP